MSKLIQAGRPWVSFDAENPNHRRWFTEFQRQRTWGTCPVRFVVPDEAGDLVTLIQRALIAHYVDQEFGKETA